MSAESPQDLRASDADREAAAARIRVAATEGRLDSDELDARLSDVYAARWCSDLKRLTADVTPPAAAPPAAPVFVRDDRSPNGLAVASLVAGLLWFGWVGSVLALVFGHIALGQIAREHGRGRGLAIAGLALGYFGMLMLALTIVVAAVE